ncbi:hypothetical protein KSP39_PZI015731 [Platanthera zijinensis]|uniref:Uncharacterized protein n=1 Tax=Platanthera zijinensis TaxID=2320716 RepID=A0AAP0G1C8_9ASPA
MDESDGEMGRPTRLEDIWFGYCELISQDFDNLLSKIHGRCSHINTESSHEDSSMLCGSSTERSLTQLGGLSGLETCGWSLGGGSGSSGGEGEGSQAVACWEEKRGSGGGAGYAGRRRGADRGVEKTRPTVGFDGGEGYVRVGGAGKEKQQAKGKRRGGRAAAYREEYGQQPKGEDGGGIKRDKHLPNESSPRGLHGVGTAEEITGMKEEDCPNIQQ